MGIPAAQPSDCCAVGADPITSLNAIPVSPAQLGAAIQLLALRPATVRRDPAAQRLALRSYVRDAALGDEIAVAAALDARIAAFRRWTEAHDSHRQSHGQAVLEAAARFQLSELDDGLGFEPAGFQELVLFIEELPW